MASLAPISDPEVKGQPMTFMGTQQEWLFCDTDKGCTCVATFPHSAGVECVGL